MIRRYCDRCGAETTKEKHSNFYMDVAKKVVELISNFGPLKEIRIKLVHADFPEVEVELCDKCKKELQEWFNGGAK